MHKPVNVENKANSTDIELKKILKQCASCTNCREKCPTYQIKPLEENFAGGRIRVLRAYIEIGLKMDDSLQNNAFFCTTCKSCEVDCPVDFTYVEYIENFRKQINTTLKSIPEKLQNIIESIRVNNNPYGELKTTRASWIPKEVQFSSDAPIAYFAGCTISYRDTTSVVKCATLLSKILKGQLQLLGEQEFCCGSVLLRTGTDETESFSLVKYLTKHINLIERKHIKTIIFSCSGCFKTVSQDWPRILKRDLPFTPIHITQFLAEKIEKNELTLKRNAETKKVIYHDPCHLGRHMGVYEEPRSILKAQPAFEAIEFEENRENALCCGAGGGFRALFPIEAINIAEKRIKEAIEKGCEELITSCVFCKLNFKAALETMGSPIKISDIEDLFFVE
jgi:heterodisulfide reductase subunit D